MLDPELPIPLFAMLKTIGAVTVAAIGRRFIKTWRKERKADFDHTFALISELRRINDSQYHQIQALIAELKWLNERFNKRGKDS